MENGRLPTFLCIGAPRCGTTWLYEALKAHPEAFVPETKEVCFFVRDQFRSTWSNGLDWYRGLFDFPDDGRIKVWGELSPRYYFLDRTPELIHDIVPSVKLIFILRHPVEILHSLAAYHLRMYPDTIDGTCYGMLDYLEHHMVEPLGFFAKHYQRFARLFAPEQIFVGFFADLQQDAVGYFARISQFLGISPSLDEGILGQRVNRAEVPQRFWFSAVMHRLSYYTPLFKRLDERINRVDYKQWAGRQRSCVTPEMFQKMMRVYEEDVHQLETIVDRDLSPWFDYETLHPAIRTAKDVRTEQ